MGWLPDEPAIVLVAITLAAVLLLTEVALPTFGLAGLSALALTVLALLAADQQGGTAWPLLGVAVAVSLWAVLLVTRNSSSVAQAVAVALFAAGSVGFGLLARDAVTVALGIAGSALLPFAFRPLRAATNRLLQLPPQTGMAALVGRRGTVALWDAGAGTVRIDGSLWNARSTSALTPGAEVTVVGFDGMTLEVAVAAPVT